MVNVTISLTQEEMSAFDGGVKEINKLVKSRANSILDNKYEEKFRALSINEKKKAVENANKS